MPDIHTLETSVHGRYLVAPPEGEPRGLLIGFHGYAENAQRHLEALRRIPGAGRWAVAAVQALHPFYNRRTGEVVASWMTSLDRELAIADNVAYTTAVARALKAAYGESLPLVWAGFSQGVAMAFRTAAGSGLPGAGMIVLAADVPPELDREALARLPPVLLGRGVEDAWYNAEKMAADRERLEAAGADLRPEVFAGGHEWHPSFLEAAGEHLERCSRGA